MASPLGFAMSDDERHADRTSNRSEHRRALGRCPHLVGLILFLGIRHMYLVNLLAKNRQSQASHPTTLNLGLICSRILITTFFVN